jgi:hypothetical protein
MPVVNKSSLISLVVGPYIYIFFMAINAVDFKFSQLLFFLINLSSHFCCQFYINRNYIQ